jgi:hypothetical protein
LKSVLGADALVQFLGQESETLFQVIAAMIECGVDVLGTEGDAGAGGDVSVLDISAEDLGVRPLPRRLLSIYTAGR